MQVGAAVQGNPLVDNFEHSRPGVFRMMDKANSQKDVRDGARSGKGL